MCSCDRVLAAPGRPTVATRQAVTSSHRPLRSGAYSKLFAAITAAVRALSANVILDVEAAFGPPVKGSQGSIVRTLRLTRWWRSSRPDPRASRNASGGARFYNGQPGTRAAGWRCPGMRPRSLPRTSALAAMALVVLLAPSVARDARERLTGDDRSYHSACGERARHRPSAGARDL